MEEEKDKPKEVSPVVIEETAEDKPAGAPAEKKPETDGKKSAGATDAVDTVEKAPEEKPGAASAAPDKKEEDSKPEAEPSTEEKDEGEESEEKVKGKKKRKSATSEGAAASPVKRDRRSRKSADTFQPADFTRLDRSVPILPGRGKPLGEFKSVKESVESHAAGSEELGAAHRLLFTMRGKPPKAEVKGNILAFSGYLPEKNKDLDKKKQEELDEEFEAKMGAKAYKLMVPQLKKLCDFFTIDRSGCSTKDSLIDILLDFLGSPSASLLKGGKSKSPEPKKKKSKKKATEEEATESEEEEEEKEEADDKADYSDVDDEKVEVTGEMPTDKALRLWVRAYVRCHCMKKATIKRALSIASEKFDVDLVSKKALLKELLTDEM